MGYYVNPQTETKEAFLEREGERISSPFLPSNGDKALVCLVKNPAGFTAAAICYDEREFAEFTRSSDTRPKTFYVVDKSALYKVSDITPKVFER